ncbi:hypothetical protein [Labilibaculum antarcticum]|uniref:Uncharacterized protein n=1 Tax=Labilibaculum antarcticum TaxID=1717717 RepID=A0A1Y1CNE7_9BACT|nr:hypothetical protein [Labilibaculum antarcticum]BAX81810.1 hypothetical protein ALGA_3512 [Labilibaculum antarcticum]
MKKQNLKKSLLVRLKNIKLFFVLLFGVLIFQSANVLAQEEKSLADHFNINLDLKNMHLWHGSVVTSGAMMASSMEYSSTDQKFILGLWGGASFSGEYKEFSYYSKYKFTNNFYAELVSHNNYSNEENPDIFSYNKYSSPNFLDIAITYTLSEDFPISIYWSTILFGEGGDYETQDDGSVTNSYSNYVELSYRIFKEKDTELKAFAGGAFSFITDKTFYSEKANMVNLGISLTHSLKIFSTSFPIRGTAMWNPETKLGALQLAITLF